MIDAGQRTVLFMDVLRQRGNQYEEHLAELAPLEKQLAVKPLVDCARKKKPLAA